MYYNPPAERIDRIEVIKGTKPFNEQDELFQRLDNELNLIENNRDWIEEQIEDEESEEEEDH